MATDVDTQHFLFKGKQHFFGVFAHIGKFHLKLFLLAFIYNIKQTDLADFMLDEETGTARVRDIATVTIGGMIADKKIKYTKNDKIMAFKTT